MNKFKLGFTLIELLIVIALLGALAVGLLAALDPFEQLKKGNDTGLRNTVGEVHGAIIRYYAIKSYQPWCTDATTCTDPAGGQTLTALNGAAYNTAITNIVNAGELKSDFVSLAGGNMDKIHVTGTNTPPTVSVCYKPTAKSFIADPNTKYTVDGLPTCATADPTQVTCYWCLQ